MHDYKNAIQVGNIDYQCSLCGELLDPNEWFLMNSFDFVDVTVVEDDDNNAQRSKKSSLSRNSKKGNNPLSK